MLRRSRELISALPHVSVVAPGAGGIPVAFEVRHVFGAEQIFWAERERGELRFRQYIEIRPGQKCVIVDDISRSGETIRALHGMLADAGADVLAVGLLVRFNIARLAVDDVPVYSLVEFETVRYPAREDCPLCAAGAPVEEVRF
jgi:orotate phosphoribosyltransferase